MIQGPGGVEIEIEIHKAVRRVRRAGGVMLGHIDDEWRRERDGEMVIPAPFSKYWGWGNL